MRTATLNSLERELLTEVKLRLLSIKEDSDLVCEPEGADCKGACVKRFVVKHLKVAGYDAAVCMSKWLSSGRVPGGIFFLPQDAVACNFSLCNSLEKIHLAYDSSIYLITV